MTPVLILLVATVAHTLFCVGSINYTITLQPVQCLTAEPRVSCSQWVSNYNRPIDLHAVTFNMRLTCTKLVSTWHQPPGQKRDL